MLRTLIAHELYKRMKIMYRILSEITPDLEGLFRAEEILGGRAPQLSRISFCR